jgi:hypothetical protein
MTAGTPAHLPLVTISDAWEGRSPRPFFLTLTAILARRGCRQRATIGGAGFAVTSGILPESDGASILLLRLAPNEILIVVCSRSVQVEGIYPPKLQGFGLLGETSNVEERPQATADGIRFGVEKDLAVTNSPPGILSEVAGLVSPNHCCAMVAGELDCERRGYHSAHLIPMPSADELLLFSGQSVGPETDGGRNESD